MTAEQILAYEALLNWELLGDLPGTEAFEAAYKELIEVERLADRYRKLIDECQRNENSRHSHPNNSWQCRDDNTGEIVRPWYKRWLSSF